MRTVLLVVNKKWEVEPLLNALTQKEFRPKELPYPIQLSSPRSDTGLNASPRASYEFHTANDPTVSVQAVVWCVQDLMDPATSSSSSEEKHRVLPTIFLPYSQVDMVVAVGTAASVVTGTSINGSVLIGGRFFMHDSSALDPNTTSQLALPCFDQLLEGGVPSAVFTLLAAKFQNAATASRLLPVVNLPPLDPQEPIPSLPQVQVDAAGISLGTVNITNYQVYDAADRATMDVFTVLHQQPTLSVETTHGLIRQATPAGVPIMFVSGIASRVYRYKQEATAPHRYLAAFNTGVVMGDIMLALSDDTSQW